MASYALRWCSLLAATSLAYAFYLPGLAPQEYEEGANVNLKVNKLTSSKTQLPYGYYTLPFCKPESIVDKIENLGEILTGDLIENSPYEIRMLEEVTCRVLCSRELDDKMKDKFRSMISDEYVINWMADSLPAATKYTTVAEKTESKGPVDPESVTYMAGFPVGSVSGGKYYVHNHVTLEFQYHANAEKYQGYRIVGFEVAPWSVTQATRSDSTEPSGLFAMCNDGAAKAGFDVYANDEIVYTYDVKWHESEVRWASRWDIYLKMTGGQVHWFAILNSLMIVMLLSGLVAMILLRTLHRDIARYNEVATAEEAREESGWKLVHGDVFREPELSMLLAVGVGTGLQILGASTITLVVALFGFLSPAHRGSLLQSLMLLFTFMGVLAGYGAGRVCKLFGFDSAKWKLTTLLTAALYPGMIFVIFFFLNLLIWGQKSSGSVPFTTMFAILVLWFGVSVPLVYVGAVLGYRQPAYELPVRVHHTPRQVPEQQWFTSPLFTSIVGGILPFGAVFTELFFIMTSLWQHQFYYLFGFLALVLAILVVTCAEISITLTYFQLTSEDYRWWWPSFFASGSSSVYVFLYSALYFSTRLQIDRLISTLLYFGYMAVLSFTFFFLTGAIGTIGTFFFVRAIYGSIKVD